jgi:PAS domain S-box-containing protein
MHSATNSSESLLRESEERYKALFESASDLIQSVRPDGSFEFVNRAWHDTLGYSPDELENLVIWDVIYPASIEECQGHFAMVMGGTPLKNIRTTFMTKAGDPIPVEGSAHSRFVGDQLVATHAFFHDISERLRSEELQARNAQLEMEKQARFLEKMAALGKLSAGLSHELNNPAAAAQRSASRMGPSVAKRDTAMRELLAAGITLDGFEQLERMVTQCVDNPPPPADRSALETSYLESELQDWLEDHGVQEAWNHTQSLVQGRVTTGDLEALARSLPDETAISPAVTWVGESLALQDMSEVITQSTGRISELVAAVKSYSFRDQALVQDVDIHEGLESTLTILAYRLKSMAVNREYDRSIPLVRTFGSGLNQVWTNILDNAADATGDAGTVTIRTRSEGDRAVIEIVDDGPGIAPDQISQIFDPFYTTKPQGEGTGLGLDIAWRIVTEEHGGRIEVESEPGNTVFRISIPTSASVEFPG